MILFLVYTVRKLPIVKSYMRHKRCGFRRDPDHCSVFRLKSFSRDLPLFVNEHDVSLLLFSLLKVNTHVFFPIVHWVSDQLPSSSIWLTTKQCSWKQMPDLPLHWWWIKMPPRNMYRLLLKNFKAGISRGCFEKRSLLFHTLNEKYSFNHENRLLLYMPINSRFLL